MELNSQPIEKPVRDSNGATLEIHSMFYTIQGEGPFAGFPAVFVRLAGCNLQCPLCDTDYTSNREVMTVARINAFVTGLMPLEAKLPIGRRLVVITGGEPFRQPIGPLLRNLVKCGYIVQVETNGTLPPPEDIPITRNLNLSRPHGVYIVCSPKSGKLNHKTAAAAMCFKYVLRAEEADDDGLPTHALMHKANPRLARPPVSWDGPIYLQPADEQDPENNRANELAVVESCMRYGYILQLQVHKMLGME